MRSALTNIEQMFGTVMFSYEVISLQETKIINVLFHDVEILDAEMSKESNNKEE